MTVLVIGGDSKLSQYLCEELFNNGIGCLRTSRRVEPTAYNNNSFIYLDLGDIRDFVVPSGVSAAVIVGGVVDYRECESNYAYAYRINCVNIPLLVLGLLRENIYVCFVSSNTVFGRRSVPPKESDIVDPRFHYAILKADTESKILSLSREFNLEGNLSIIRLTKNVDANTEPFCGWLARLTKGLKVKAFRDLFFAPVTFSSSAYAIRRVISHKSSGVFHFSGVRDINYEDFAVGLCDYLGVPRSLVEGTTSSEAGVRLLYSERITSLQMERTAEVLGLAPVPVEQVYEVLRSLFFRQRDDVGEFNP